MAKPLETMAPEARTHARFVSHVNPKPTTRGGRLADEAQSSLGVPSLIRRSRLVGPMLAST